MADASVGKEQMKKLTLLTSLLLAAIICLAGCNTATPDATATPQSGITVTDLSGVTVTLDKAPTKVVSLVPSVTELLFEMGAGSLICGRDSYSNYPSQAAEIPVMGDYNGPNLELIVAAQPDVVFTAGKLQQDAEDKLRQAGIVVINAEAGTLEQVTTSIALLGDVCGKKEKAQQMVSQFRAGVDAIKALDIKKVSAYYMVSSGEYGEWSVGPGSFIFDALTLGGAELITKDMEYSYPQYSVESIVQKNPYVIIADSNTTLEYLQSHEALGELDAVKNGRVIIMDADTVSRPTLRFISAIKECLERMHAFN